MTTASIGNNSGLDLSAPRRQSGGFLQLAQMRANGTESAGSRGSKQSTGMVIGGGGATSKTSDSAVKPTFRRKLRKKPT